MDITVLTWDDVEHLVDSIANDIKDSNWLPTYIVGLVRGGLCPATMLSHKLGIKMHTLDVSLRDGKDGYCESNLWMPEDVADAANVLIVDDTNDSGATLNWIRDDWYSSIAGIQPPKDVWWHDRVKIATVVNNLASSEKVDYSGKTVDKSSNPTWISFPWESTITT